jgi:hypothetical protein
MNARRCLRTLVLSIFPVVLALSASLTSVTACGSDVASCGTICAPGTSCDAECMNLEARCASSQAGSDFQVLLTCIGNANGSLNPLPTLCQPAMNAVTSNCTGQVGTDSH